MRIGNYEPQVGAPRIPQLATPKVPPPPDLSQIIGLVENQYEEYQKEQEEYKKAFIINEQSRASLAIDQAYAELQDAIDNGGAYAGAEKTFKEKYNKITADAFKNLDPIFQERPDVAASIRADFERSGLEYGLRLKDKVRGRVKSDAISSTNQSVEMAKSKYTLAKTFEERQAIVADVSNKIGSLESSGMIPKGAGKQKIAEFVNDVRGLELELISQDEKNPAIALAFLEKNKTDFSPESYVNYRGQLLQKQEQYVSLQNAQKTISQYAENPQVSKPPKQEDIDLVFNNAPDEIRANNDEVIKFVNSVQAVPSSLVNRARIDLTTFSEEYSSEDYLRVAQTARLVGEIQKNPQIKNLENSFNKDVEQAANLINERIDNGATPEIAVKETLRRLTDKDFKQRYEQARKDIFKAASRSQGKVAHDLDAWNFFGAKFKIFGETAARADGQVVSEFSDIAAMQVAMGASESEAKSIARKQIESTYDTFNGVFIKQPPHLLTPYSRESWENVAQQIAQKKGITNKVVLSAFSETFRVRNSGEKNPTKLPFAVMVSYGPNEIVPLMEEVEVNGKKTSRLKIVYASPEMKMVSEPSRIRKPGARRK